MLILRAQCTPSPVPRSASLIHRPIPFPGVFTLGLSRKALPRSCEALLKPAQRFCPGASLRNEPRAENTRGLEYWRKHSVILERRGPRSAGEIESDTPTSCFRFFPFFLSKTASLMSSLSLSLCPSPVPTLEVPPTSTRRFHTLEGLLFTSTSGSFFCYL